MVEKATDPNIRINELERRISKLEKEKESEETLTMFLRKHWWYILTCWVAGIAIVAFLVHNYFWALF